MEERRPTQGVWACEGRAMTAVQLAVWPRLARGLALRQCGGSLPIRSRESRTAKPHHTAVPQAELHRRFGMGGFPGGADTRSGTVGRGPRHISGPRHRAEATEHPPISCSWSVHRQAVHVRADGGANQGPLDLQIRPTARGVPQAAIGPPAQRLVRAAVRFRWIDQAEGTRREPRHRR